MITADELRRMIADGLRARRAAPRPDTQRILGTVSPREAPPASDAPVRKAWDRG